MEVFSLIIDYLIRILPGIVVIGLFFIVVKPKSNLRIVMYILIFIILRDTMTPLELWFIGQVKGVLWIRLSTNSTFLILFGLSSLTFVMLMNIIDQENKKYLLWFKKNKLVGLMFGVLGCLVVVTPLLILYSRIDVSNRGGMVSASLMLPTFIFALLGNFLEESLFRGYIIGFLLEYQKPLIAGISSGIIFAVCHVFLAITVTDIGTPLILFTLWEGIIAGLIGVKYGIIPATITHGGAIFLLSSGLL